jgi:hypothetical protein
MVQVKTPARTSDPSLRAYRVRAGFAGHQWAPQVIHWAPEAMEGSSSWIRSWIEINEVMGEDRARRRRLPPRCRPHRCGGWRQKAGWRSPGVACLPRLDPSVPLCTPSGGPRQQTAAQWTLLSWPSGSHLRQSEMPDLRARHGDLLSRPAMPASVVSEPTTHEFGARER